MIDVNRRVLQEAQAGLYGDFSLRNTSSYFRHKYFRSEGQQFRLVPEVAAMVTYAKAVVEMDRARGATLDRNGIEYQDALSGTISKNPVTSFNTGSGEVK